MWRTRRCIDAWRSLPLHVSWHTLRTVWRGRKTRAALPTTSHDALEEVSWSMADGWWRWLRVAAVPALWRATALLELAVKALDLFFVPEHR